MANENAVGGEGTVEALVVDVVRVEGRATEGINAVGLIVTWTPRGEAVEQDVKDAFAKAGLGQHAPKPRTLKDALKSALVNEFSKKNRPVRPTKKGYEVVEETPEGEGFTNSRTPVVAAWVEMNKAAGGSEQVRCDDPAYLPRLNEQVAEAKARVEGAWVGEALASVAKHALHGVAIRDGGGAYWIPQSSVATWFTLADALASVRGGVSTRPFSIVGDQATVSSLVESASAKVEDAIATIYGKIAEEGKGHKALTTLAEEAVTLAEQIETWEKTLGSKLDDLREKVEAAQTAAAQAAQIALAARNEAA